MGWYPPVLASLDCQWDSSTGLVRGAPRGVPSIPLGASGRALLKKINRDGTAHSDCGHHSIGWGQGGRKGGKEQDRQVNMDVHASTGSLCAPPSLSPSPSLSGLLRYELVWSHQTHPGIMDWNLPPFIASLGYFIMVTIKAVYHPYRFISWNFK